VSKEILWPIVVTITGICSLVFGLKNPLKWNNKHGAITRCIVMGVILILAGIVHFLILERHGYSRNGYLGVLRGKDGKPYISGIEAARGAGEWITYRQGKVIPIEKFVLGKDPTITK